MNFKQTFVALCATAIFMPFGAEAQSWDINGNTPPLNSWLGTNNATPLIFKVGGVEKMRVRNEPYSILLMSDAAAPASAWDTDPNAGVTRSGIDVQLKDLTHTYGGKTAIRSEVEFGSNATSFTGKALGYLASLGSWHAGGGGVGAGGNVTLSRGLGDSYGGGFSVKLENATIGSTQFNNWQRRVIAGVYGHLEGTIASVDAGAILTGVYGFDSLKRADTWAGYFQGKGHFTDKVSIGSAPMVGNYGLYVENGILTEKVKVALKSTTQWADFVFAPRYKLRSLNDVEAFIKKNHHLPDVPSAEKVAKEGLDLADMMKIQMQKLEELTLYIIAQQKEIDALKAKAK